MKLDKRFSLSMYVNDYPYSEVLCDFIICKYVT